MVRITIDDELRRKFLDFTDDIELSDESGRVLARFQRSTPWSDPDQWEPITPEISPEEIQQRLNLYERSYTTIEVLDKLGKL
jgi:hypothetical protein